MFLKIQKHTGKKKRVKLIVTRLQLNILFALI